MFTMDRVTVTGADDSTSPDDLVRLSEIYPFVEWGILLSRSQEGGARFPSLGWIAEFRAAIGRKAPLSGHLCGAWVRDLVGGRNTFVEERPSISKAFDRVQLNFHAQPHQATGQMTHALRRWGVRQYIFQFDDANNDLMNLALQDGIDAVPLFDTSGGAGVYPDSWPSPFRGASCCGYAGGLHPDKIAAQMGDIQRAAADARIWVDIETHVRTPDDRALDMTKVETFLAAVEPFVVKSARKR